jgi:hypothetical protein
MRLQADLTFSDFLLYDFYATHFGFMDDGWRNHLEHHFVAGQGKQMIVGKACGAGKQYRSGSRLGARFFQKRVDFVFEKLKSPFLGSGGK